MTLKQANHTSPRIARGQFPDAQRIADLRELDRRIRNARSSMQTLQESGRFSQAQAMRDMARDLRARRDHLLSGCSLVTRDAYYLERAEAGELPQDGIGRLLAAVATAPEPVIDPDDGVEHPERWDGRA